MHHDPTGGSVGKLRPLLCVAWYSELLLITHDSHVRTSPSSCCLMVQCRHMVDKAHGNGKFMTKNKMNATECLKKQFEKKGEQYICFHQNEHNIFSTGECYYYHQNI